jgi:glyoxylase-like metal-dependent hydrolase (beta-lactamase superfamily II)
MLFLCSMTTVHHLNCGRLQSPFIGKAICHCLLLEDKNGLALVDTGFGTADVQDPAKRLGSETIDFFSIELDINLTALKQIQKMNFNARDVKHCIITHLDFDHIGGLADFPDAIVHLSGEEYKSYKSGNPRFLPAQFEHRPKFYLYDQATTDVFGWPARKLDLDFESNVFLIPLFGHTIGHCGVAIEQKGKWIVHVADAFYTQEELKTEDHPVTIAAAGSAENNADRLESFKRIKLLAENHAEVEIICYHDPAGLNKN